MENLKNLIKKKGYSLKGFGENVLQMDSRAFAYRMKHQSFTYLELEKILEALECKFEDLKKTETE